MPELPEVETVRRGLVPVMEGVRIAKADVNRPDLRWPFPDRMSERLSGATIERLRRRSKYILADLDTGESLLIHLGMSGRMLISGAKIGQFTHDHPPAEKHDHVVFHMENGARVTFNDPRRFGAMDLLDTKTAKAAPLRTRFSIKASSPVWEISMSAKHFTARASRQAERRTRFRNLGLPVLFRLSDRS